MNAPRDLHASSTSTLPAGARLPPVSQLDGSPLSKGGVRLIPGSHRQGLFEMLTRKAYLLDHRPDPDAFALEAEAGDLTLHDGRIWHRVAQATATGDARQRRVMYPPVMSGPLEEKHENGPTPLYFRLKRLAGC